MADYILHTGKGELLELDVFTSKTELAGAFEYPLTKSEFLENIDTMLKLVNAIEEEQKGLRDTIDERDTKIDELEDDINDLESNITDIKTVLGVGTNPMRRFF